MNKQTAPIYELVSIQGALKTQTLKDGWIYLNLLNTECILVNPTNSVLKIVMIDPISLVLIFFFLQEIAVI